MKNTKAISILRNQKGIIMIDFIFALVISIGVSAVFFALCFTLSVVEITQYIAFASARSHAAAHLNIESQQNAARAKYTELVSSSVFAPLYAGGWFQISKPNELEVKSGGASGDSFNSDYSSGNEGTGLIPFVGVRISLNAKMLDFNVPFIGKTSNEENGFATKVTGFLIREPTLDECQTFMKARHAAIKNLDSTRFAALNIRDDEYVPMEDNGC